jgi:DNA-binding MarR family transcriptional regulator
MVDRREPDREPPLSRETSLGYQANHLARLLEQSLRDRIAEHGVVPGQFAQLLALYEDDGLTQNELCARVRIDQSTMAHTLKRMERDGLVVRTPDPDDRRRAHVTLTSRAGELRPRLTEAASAVNAAATKGLTPAEVGQYLELTARLIANLEADH